MIDRGLIAALGLSVLAHGTLLAGEGWHWADGEPETAQTLSAALRTVAVPVTTAPAVVAAAAPAAPPARKQAPPAFAPIAASSPPTDVISDAAPEPLFEQAAAPGALEPPLELAEAEAAPEAESAAPDLGESFALDGWPAHGAIVYRVYLGSAGLQVGEARHDWFHDDTSYRMQVTLETTGLAALLHGFHYVQKSEGELGPEGLRPNQFTVAQKGKKLESALFDWDNAKVSIRRGERERRNAALQTGDQDVLSLWHQIGIVGTAGLPREIMVVSNKEATPALLEAVGDEGLSLPIGRLETLRVRAQAQTGVLTIDIWLARNYGMLPVRIRMVDDKGEVLDQQAVQLRLAPPDGKASETAAAVDSIELKEEAPTEPLANLYTN
ncbi:hypothetical protein CEW83_08900 [Parazoarcus communis]|uniref:DUF3108 domain-containing protein n=1 Tax=Parazoarcus communis TaxID=41977 RepID=A0A2U8GP68_9RHOO|nr:DUF3108 domain-containing protein [Parazoarcus communis]AWI75314.1 hypothetical protein CEW83_08900 [Parazoarcus communis]|tara:strand:- start:24020 stop:25165 length:1146 start_codon:yes stop_codon:yes gene_type:complete